MALAAPGSADPLPASREGAIVAEINRARADPAGYAETLKAYRRLYRGRLVRQPGEPEPLLTKEGPRAVDEAIAYVRRARPLPPLGWDAALALAADDHVRAQGARGLTGHAGPDGSTPGRRITRRGVGYVLAGETIAYGPRDAVAVVRELIVDDGVADRNHRTVIFTAALDRAGAACGPHRDYGTMCVIDFAGGRVR